MRLIQRNPIFVKGFEVNNFCRCFSDIIISGKCPDKYYYSNIIFSPLKIDNNTLQKAILKLNCTKICSNNPVRLYINNNTIKNDVCGIGVHEWDVTSISQNFFDSDFSLCLYPDKNFWGIKEFSSLGNLDEPVLELYLRDSVNIVNTVRKYNSTNILNYTDWIDCSDLNKYYYFIENTGIGSVYTEIQISPDKNMIINDSQMTKINAGETIYMQPMRESRYVRIAYKNAEPNHANIIKVWYQGKI